MKQYISLFLAALMCMAGMNAWALEPNANGVYEIGSAQDLVDFATLVNDGQNSAGAVLTADIDMASITSATSRAGPTSEYSTDRTTPSAISP